MERRPTPTRARTMLFDLVNRGAISVSPRGRHHAARSTVSSHRSQERQSRQSHDGCQNELLSYDTLRLKQTYVQCSKTSWTPHPCVCLAQNTNDSVRGSLFLSQRVQPAAVILMTTCGVHTCVNMCRICTCQCCLAIASRATSLG